MQQPTEIFEKKYKIIEYANDKLQTFNNIDRDVLNEDSQFPIADVTKLFSIVCLLILNEKKIIDIMGTFGTNGFDSNSQLINVKIMDVINHKAGITNEISSHNFEEASSKKYKNATKVYNTFKNEVLITNQIGVHEYSNIGFIILGALVEFKTGKNYKKIFKKLIFKPLKMKHTGFKNPKTLLYNSKCQLLTKNLKNEKTYASFAGGIVSTINDLIKFSGFVDLLNEESLEILKTHIECWRTKNWRISKESASFSYEGSMSGIRSMLDIEYDFKCVLKKVRYIKLETARN